MFRHPGCSFVETVCPASGVVNFIVALLLPMWYIRPGVMLLLLGEGVLEDVLLSVAGHLYLSFSRSGSVDFVSRYGFVSRYRAFVDLLQCL